MFIYVLPLIESKGFWNSIIQQIKTLVAVSQHILTLFLDKQIDLTKVNLKKLKVKDLKKILSDWGEDSACKGCAEKSDFIKKVEELMPKYAPEAAKIREDLQKNRICRPDPFIIINQPSLNC